MIIFKGLLGLLLGGASAVGCGIRDGVRDDCNKSAARARGKDTYYDSHGKERLVSNNHRVSRITRPFTTGSDDLLLCDMDRNYKVIKNLTLERIEEEREIERKKAIENGEKYYTLLTAKETGHEPYPYIHRVKYYSVEDDEMYVRRRIYSNSYFMHIKSRLIGEQDPLIKDKPFKSDREAEWIKKWNYAVSKLGLHPDDYLEDMADDYEYSGDLEKRINRLNECYDDKTFGIDELNELIELEYKRLFEQKYSDIFSINVEEEEQPCKEG